MLKWRDSPYFIFYDVLYLCAEKVELFLIDGWLKSDISQV